MGIKTAEFPNFFKKLFACRNCKLVKTREQFAETNCENCAQNQANDQKSQITNHFVGLAFHYELGPNIFKKLFACRNCKLVKTREQFAESNCENCAQNQANDQKSQITNHFVGLAFHYELGPNNLVAKATNTKMNIAGFYALKLESEDEQTGENNFYSEDEFEDDF